MCTADQCPPPFTLPVWFSCGHWPFLSCPRPLNFDLPQNLLFVLPTPLGMPATLMAKNTITVWVAFNKTELCFAQTCSSCSLLSLVSDAAQWCFIISGQTPCTPLSFLLFLGLYLQYRVRLGSLLTASSSFWSTSWSSHICSLQRLPVGLLGPAAARVGLLMVTGDFTQVNTVL